MTDADINNTGINKEDLFHAYSFIHNCGAAKDSQDFHRHILTLSNYLGFEFVYYAYLHNTFNTVTHRRDSMMVNLTNPREWMEEYSRIRENNPLIVEIERQHVAGKRIGYCVLDQYDWTLSKEQQQHITRRRDYGLEFGCAVFASSEKRNFAIILCLESRDRVPDERTKAIAQMIIQPMLTTKKRLVVQELVASLTEKEQRVADRITSGSTCKAIARHLGTTENTVKFHLKNIYAKLQVNNRQQAAVVLLAERYLGL